jgi:hypothetical protein
MAAVLEGGTGKFTFLLQVIDTAGNQFDDVQRAWIDNEPVKAAITGIAGLPRCGDLYTQTNAGVFKTVNIQGTAWDQLIDPVTPDFTRPTSDNFDLYTVKFQKQGATGYAQLIDSTTPFRHDRCLWAWELSLHRFPERRVCWSGQRRSRWSFNQTLKLHKEI